MDTAIIWKIEKQNVPPKKKQKNPKMQQFYKWMFIPKRELVHCCMLPLLTASAIVLAKTLNISGYTTEYSAMIPA